MRAAHRDEVGAAIAAQPVAESVCLESDSCLGDVGQTVSAELVLAVTMAGLGKTRLVRTRLVRSGAGFVTQDLQETVERSGAGFSGYADELAARVRAALA